MPTSFLDLPLELRDEIYKLIIPKQRGASGARIPLETDTTYWEDPKYSVSGKYTTQVCRKRQKNFFAWDRDS